MMQLLAEAVVAASENALCPPSQSLYPLETGIVPSAMKGATFFSWVYRDGRKGD